MEESGKKLKLTVFGKRSGNHVEARAREVGGGVVILFACRTPSRKVKLSSTPVAVPTNRDVLAWTHPPAGRVV